MIIEGKTAEWEIVVGIEVHAQVKSATKLFSSAPTTFGAPPNENVALFDVALPGMLPVLNDYCITQAIKTGLATDARINLTSYFERKNYFYPDLPSGYQITQLSEPIVIGGEINILDDNGDPKKIRINHIHLEQDAGKSMHSSSANTSLIDYNRAGVPLMEIVSEADIRTPNEAANYIKKLRTILQYIDACDGDMEKGQMRCDANVSVRKVGVEEFGIRREIKNLNSTRNIALAIEYEARNQVFILESGEKVEQETCLFNANTGKTMTLRSKENANDYRYFPDPDLLPLNVSQDLVDSLRSTLPELPDQLLKRYMEEYSLSYYDASVLTVDKSTAEFFNEVIKKHDPKVSANWITVELFARLKKLDLSIQESPVSPTQMSSLLDLISDSVISGKIAKQVLDSMIETGKSPEIIVEEQGLKQITNVEDIEKIINKVLEENQDKVSAYKDGKVKLYGFFIGQIMKASDGKANPELVNKVLSNLLKH